MKKILKCFLVSLALQMFFIVNIYPTMLAVEDFKLGPNPFDPNSESLHIQYILSKTADTEFIIYTLRGKKVWEHSINNDPAGIHEAGSDVLWDGADRSGSIVPNGIYILYIMADDGEKKVNLKKRIGVLR